MLLIQELYKTYDKNTPVLKGATAEVREGAFASIRGPSGSGKSTLLLILGALLQPDSGTIQFHGQDLFSLSGRDQGLFRAKNMGFVFQQFHLLPYLTVEENILTASLAVKEAPKKQRAHELMDQLGILHRKDHVPGRLSVGEQQRTALARALYHHPKLLLADEPTGNLDPENTAIVLDAFQTYVKNRGTVVLVTHSPEMAQAADQQWRIQDGKLGLE